MLISTTPNTKMHYLKYFKSRRKLNIFRKKLAITPFFSECNELQEETLYQLGSYTLQSKKMEKPPKSIFFFFK